MGRGGSRAPRGVRNSDKPAVASAKEDELFETLADLPADPEDARLTIEGAVLAADGKLDVAAYEDLHSQFAGEPSPALHPNPDRPGVRKGEQVPQGMRTWDDLRAGAKGGKDGAGWIAVRNRKGEPKKEKWFNIRTCGSWRLAFLLARLQRELFERGIGVPGVAAPVSAAPGASEPNSSAAESAKSTENRCLTPQKKRLRPPAAKASAKKRARQEEVVGTDVPKVAAEPSTVKTQVVPGELAASKFGSAVVAGSVRLQQILAARLAQQQQV